MSWAVIPGSPHGGPLPTPSVDGITPDRVEGGDSVVITGSNFTPGTEVVLVPGNIVVGKSLPTVTDEITITLPLVLSNVKYSLFADNGIESNRVDLFVLRDVTFTPSNNDEMDITIMSAN